MDETEKISRAITKALAYAENGGKPDIDNPRKGKTGELKSIYQFTPSTWKLYAKEVMGDENSPLTADNETYVVNEKVKKWVNQGYTSRQIASMWNAGEKEKDAYTGKFSNGQPSTGVNKKYGVKFDVPSYASKVQDYSKEFYSEKPKEPLAVAQKEGGNTALSTVLSLIKQGSSSSKRTTTVENPPEQKNDQKTNNY